MPIHNKDCPEGQFVAIRNALARTKKLSPTALGILVHLLSMPPETNPKKGDVKQSIPKISQGGFDKAYKELMQSGYLYCHEGRGKGNRITYEWHVSGKSLKESEFQELVQGSNSPQQVKSSPGKQDKQKHCTKDTKDNKGVNSDSLFDTLTEGLQEDIRDIFEVWNHEEFVQHESKKWQRHTKISKSIIKAIEESRKEHSVEEITEAIENYAKVFLADDENEYWYPHRYRLEKFLTANRYSDSDDPPYYRFLPDQFRLENYIPFAKRSKDQQEIEDKYPETTNNLIVAYGQIIGNDGYEPNNTKDINCFRRAAIYINEFNSGVYQQYFERDKLEYLFQCIEKRFNNKQRGVTITPGHLISDHIWEVLMPQDFPDHQAEVQSDRNFYFGDQIRHEERMKKKQESRLRNWRRQRELAMQIEEMYFRDSDNQKIKSDKWAFFNMARKLLAFHVHSGAKGESIRQEKWVPDLLDCLAKLYGKRDFRVRRALRDMLSEDALPAYYKDTIELPNDWDKRASELNDIDVNEYNMIIRALDESLDEKSGAA